MCPLQEDVKRRIIKNAFGLGKDIMDVLENAANEKLGILPKTPPKRGRTRKDDVVHRDSSTDQTDKTASPRDAKADSTSQETQPDHKRDRSNV